MFAWEVVGWCDLWVRILIVCVCCGCTYGSWCNVAWMVVSLMILCIFAVYKKEKNNWSFAEQSVFASSIHSYMTLTVRFTNVDVLDLYFSEKLPAACNSTFIFRGQWPYMKWARFSPQIQRAGLTTMLYSKCPMLFQNSVAEKKCNYGFVLCSKCPALFQYTVNIYRYLHSVYINRVPQ